MNRPSCNCVDYPCCGCGPEPSQEEQHEQFEAEHGEREDYDGDESMDGDHESALESVYGPSDPPDYFDDTPLGHEYGDGFDHD